VNQSYGGLPIIRVMTLIIAGILLNAMFLNFKQPNVHPVVDIAADLQAEAAEAA